MACESLRSFVKEEDLERYFDIYDVQMTDLEDAEFGFNEHEFDDMESLKALKALLHRLHTIRRVFMCSLMAIDADGRHADYAKWGTVVDQLKTLGNSVAELAGELKRISTEEEGTLLILSVLLLMLTAIQNFSSLPALKYQTLQVSSATVANFASSIRYPSLSVVYKRKCTSSAKNPTAHFKKTQTYPNSGAKCCNTTTQSGPTFVV